jgi:hypothetical protein
VGPNWRAAKLTVLDLVMFKICVHAKMQCPRRALSVAQRTAHVETLEPVSLKILFNIHPCGRVYNLAMREGDGQCSSMRVIGLAQKLGQLYAVDGVL